ncbi:MAG: hypothetical protein HY710_04170, partial [Candidatus Latescibacteria bacterium]|nr:hypothetical protein [Candidatus Latescibacterota bacterium]
SGPLKDLLDQVGGIERYVLDPEPDADGYLMVTGFGALHTAIIEKGLKPDFRSFEFWGPDNQECWVMRASAYSYLATRDRQFLDDLVRMWTAVIEREDHGCGLPYRGANGFVEDFSFHYSDSPLSNYEMSLYDHAMMALYADVIRIQRMGGLRLPSAEEFFRRWARACQTRSMLYDGTSNAVLNLAGWERAWCTDWHSTWVWPLIALSDLSLLQPEEIKYIVEAAVQAFDERLDSDRQFPVESGLLGYSQTDGRLTEIGYRCYEIALLLLTESRFFEMESRRFDGTLSSLAWKDRFFVMQNPAYILTIVGAGPGYDHEEDHGTPCSGGEYHLKLPFGPFLTPLSDHGRPSVDVVVEGDTLSSSQVCLHRANETNPQMGVVLPDGRRLREGEIFGDLLYDPMAYETLHVQVAFGNQRVRVERLFHLQPDRVVITDTVRALRPVIIDKATSRVPLITINPWNEIPRIRGVSGRKRIELLPPFYLCVEGACHRDRTIIKSLTRLDTLRVTYGDYGFVLNQLSADDIRLDLTNFEWLENRRMRVAGKNLDCLWVFQPTPLEEGEERCFQYEILPFFTAPQQETAALSPETLDEASIDDDA